MTVAEVVWMRVTGKRSGRWVGESEGLLTCRLLSYKLRQVDGNEST